MRTIGPIKLIGSEINEEVHVPLATFETPLWPSVARGARVTTLSGGIYTATLNDGMTRSVILEAPSLARALSIKQDINETVLGDVVKRTSQFATLKSIHTEILGTLLYIRFCLTTGDAAGHNMVTKAADHMIAWLLEQHQDLRYISISGNMCVDKKVSAINGLLGRGKHVIAEVTLPRHLCETILRTTPEALVDLHIKKNLLGSILAGSLRSANAHFANMLLAFYLATGQDAANIVEGSQGITHAEMKGDDLYFSVSLPNLIIGSVGNGKSLPFVQENLALLGCLDKRKENARRLALIAAGVVLCGELSLLAAQTNQGELMRSHLSLERFTL